MSDETSIPDAREDRDAIHAPLPIDGPDEETSDDPAVTGEIDGD